MFQICGEVSPGWEEVKAKFKANFESGADENAQLCIYHRGQKVVDLWGVAKGTDFNGNSLTLSWSSNKSIASIAMAWLVDKGHLEYHDLVTKHWPKFGQNGKDAIKVEDVLRHEGRLPAFSKPIPDEDLTRERIKTNAVGRLIEEQVPHEVHPESPREYHALTRGAILNEIFRRAHPQGWTIGEWVEEILYKTQGLDCHLGSSDPAVQDRFVCPRIRSLRYILLQALNPFSKDVFVGPKALLAMVRTVKKTSSKGNNNALFLASLRKEDKLHVIVKAMASKEVRRTEIPSANGLSTARGYAKLGAIIANRGVLGSGERLLSQTAVEKMEANPIRRPNMAILGVEDNFSQGGLCVFNKDLGEHHLAKSIGMLPRDGYIGWFGLGGSVFQYHPENQIGFGYVPTLLHWEDVGGARGTQLQAVALKIAKRIDSAR
ncbi:hypothetical protein TCAL_09008 [Tigriopus californicus]|uniref:Beta-lactamase-related domain-containing protein n=1 Tax=Tigriopus californicus TaxID=6832 RepID=A0A553PU35_TIGCA|nr:esterase/beta-lactamase LipL-like [Tigriopus californicus]TRY81200.1 hypothetical protein TCAL_09008 [Tigriopus californicus]|eukprot:TCALIF_09008-PA protein Name:"Similar to lact-2 Beta-lactamase domain-containing protein 2 (Caenorhabditis elegans)" AED:0.00 eAED:0.00 QI:156/1/1/1/1/1/2/105/431